MSKILSSSSIVDYSDDDIVSQTCKQGDMIMKQEFDKNDLMVPPWLMYPHIRRYSIGWRMGYGESYIYKFGEWFTALSQDDQKMYQQMFPTPIGWFGWYEEEIADDDNYDGSILLWNKDGGMKYSLDSLQLEYQSGKKIDYLFFWGHQPSVDGSISKTCLSQWWKSDFYIDIDKYCCMEQYMMAEKARLFNDDEILTKIMKSNDPKQIKELGRKVRNFTEDEWEKKRYSIILNGNFAKFLQNEDLKQFLLGTKNKVIVEASPYDKIWGIGMALEDKDINNFLIWKGQNLLGFALMEVRDEINRVCQNESKLNIREMHE